jgi:hypothetical protein
MAGQDVDDIYKMKASDRGDLVRALVEPQPFARLIECGREGKRVPVIFTRSFYDRAAMYCAIELKWSYADVLAVTSRLGFGEAVVPGFDAAKAQDACGVDPKLFKYLNSIYASAEVTCPPKEWPSSSEGIANAIYAICDFLGVQLELDAAIDLEDHTEAWFSFRRCAELAIIFACVARRYTHRRVLGVELCRCMYTYRLSFFLELDSRESEGLTTDIIGNFAKITDVTLNSERGETCVYQAIPMELELEVAGVKERF